MQTEQVKLITEDTGGNCKAYVFKGRAFIVVATSDGVYLPTFDHPDAQLYIGVYRADDDSWTDPVHSVEMQDSLAALRTHVQCLGADAVEGMALLQIACQKALETADAKILARRFCESLEQVLGADGMEKVRELNRAEPWAGVCHSADFCDSNMVMFDAFEQHMRAQGLTDFDDFDCTDDAEQALWNAAWSFAIRANLESYRLPQVRTPE